MFRKAALQALRSQRAVVGAVVASGSYLHLEVDHSIAQHNVCRLENTHQESHGISETKDAQESDQPDSKKILSSSTFKIQDFYDIQKVLGEGTYGLVYEARRKLDGALVALKTMPRSLTGKTDFEREVAALQLLSKPPGHPHVVKFYDLHRDDSHYYLSLELIEGGELLEHLIENGPYAEAHAASFLRQFAEALCFVHTNGLSHADLKPENLLLSSNDITKAKLILADFGSARSHDLSRKEMHLPMAEFAIGCSFLHLTALGNQFELEKMLQERPSLVNFRDYDFRTALHLAASEGHVDICRFLIEKGARVNRADRWGGTALDDAHRSRHRDVIEYLRKNGATFGTKTQLPRFIQSASQGDIEELRALLEFGNIDVDEGDYDHRTALHLAAGEGRLEIVQLLCQEGANPNVEDRWQNRPLDDAQDAKKNSKAVMSTLVKAGARSLKNPALHLEVREPDEHIQGESPRSSYNSKRNRDKEQECFSDMNAWRYVHLRLIPRYISAFDNIRHPFDKDAELSDYEIQRRITSVGLDNENSRQDLEGMVFDDRIEGLSESCVDLMRKLMDPDPETRLSSDAFLRHPWIQGLTASWTTMGKTHSELKAFWQNRFRAEIVKKFADVLGISGEMLSEHDLATIFNALDIKKNGVLELEEIQQVFHDIGISEKNIHALFSSADLDGTGVIHFDEFRALFSNKSSGSGQDLHVDYLQQRFKSHLLHKFAGEAEKDVTADKNKLREIFQAIDLEGNGIWDANDIRQFLRTVGEPEDVISRIVASLDTKRCGRVSWDDFLYIMGMKS
ncbi:MAG: hypothetical protein SGILL_007511 [Bacillariaceae sp.]